jgi:hypothetical protein
MSPGTSSAAGTSSHAPSRSTFAPSASLFFSRSIASLALFSCQKPTTAFAHSRTKMMTRSSQDWMAAEMTAAASIIYGIGPQK